MTRIIEVVLPTLHPGQVRAYQLLRANRFVAARCGRRWGKCVASGTRITLANGLVRRVEDIVTGDVVLTLNEDTWLFEPKSVTGVQDNGIKDVVEVSTNGRRLSCTPNHPILTGRGWCFAGSILTTDLIAVNTGAGLDWEEVRWIHGPPKAQTWDLSVADNHNFLAEGVVTHNTDLGKVLACDAATKGKSVGWFAPTYKIQSEAYNEINDTLAPVKQASSKVEGVVRTITKGRVDFWTMEDERAGRSRRYHLAIIDEAAFTKANAMAIWEQSIKPTLFDFTGKCLVISNTNGISTDNFLWQVCHFPEKGFVEFHSPTHENPHVPLRMGGESDVDYYRRRDAEFKTIQDSNHPLVYQQEYLAEFVDWSGSSIFPQEKLLVNNKPVNYPPHCDAVFAVIDSAVKTGTDNDGTAVIYCARSRHVGTPLIILDWDILQIEGSLLEVWIPGVYQRLEELAALCKARGGSQGAFIEDAQSGSILLQQCARRGLMARALPSDLTSAGKDGRAISVSGYVHQEMVKISEYAFLKTKMYKGASRNHLITQVAGYRIGDKDAARRADDLLDTFTYAIAISLGDSKGF